MKKTKTILISLILLTTTPFLLLYANLADVWQDPESAIFLDKLAFITANVAGYIGAVLLIWSFLLGIRSLVSLVTADLVWSVKVHKWIGKYGLLLVFVHPILEMYTRSQNFFWLFSPDFSSSYQSHISFGRFAFLLFLIVYITSAIIRYRIKYRPWKYIHYLSYPMLFLIFIHAVEIGTYLNKHPALNALWSSLFIAYFGLIIYRLIDWSGILKPQYILSSSTIHSDNIIVQNYSPQNRKISPLPGQYTYLQIRGFGESHPFSIMSYDKVTGNITFGIKNQGSFTDKISKLKIGSRVRLEKPYGVFTREAQNDKPKILIASGVGITPFVDLIKNYTSDQTTLLYANKKLEDTLLHVTFCQTLGKRYTSFINQEKGADSPNVTYGHILSTHIIQAAGGQEHVNNYQYFICGGPSFMKNILTILTSLEIPQNQIYTEEFSN